MSLVSRALGVDDASFVGSQTVQLILLVSMVSSMGSVASPALPAMSAALGVDPARIGLVFTAFTLPAIVVLPAVGAIGDLYSRRAVVVPGLLLFGTAGLAVGLVHDFGTILVLRGLQGVGYTAFNAMTVALLGDVLSGRAESAAQGLRVLLNKATGFVGPVVAGVLAAIAWNDPFLLYALAIPVGLLAFVGLHPARDEDGPPDPTTDGGADTEDEDEAAGQFEAASRFQSARGALRDYGTAIADLVRDPFVAGILAGGFVRMVLKYGLYVFLPLAVTFQYGGSPGEAGLLVGLYSLAGAVVASQTARLTSALSHVYALVLGFLLAGLAFVAFPLAGGLLALAGLVVVHGVGEGIVNPVHKSLMSQSVEADVRAGLVTTNALVQDVAKTVTPVALGALLVVVGADAYDSLFLLVGAGTLLATGLAVVALRVGDPSARRAGL